MQDCYTCENWHHAAIQMIATDCRCHGSSGSIQYACRARHDSFLEWLSALTGSSLDCTVDSLFFSSLLSTSRLAILIHGDFTLQQTACVGKQDYVLAFLGLETKANSYSTRNSNVENQELNRFNDWPSHGQSMKHLNSWFEYLSS